jgi:hypothetical protein
MCKLLIVGVSILSFFVTSAAAGIFGAQVVPNLSCARITRPKITSMEAGEGNAAIGCSSLGENVKRPAIGSHSVTLSWNASLPASKSPHGVILGYIVYRSTKSHDRNALPINFVRITGTTFSDCNVEPGKTYYYTARAVDAIGRTSVPSNEVRVKIPR